MTEQRIVHCIKLNKDLPGLKKPPLPGELGQKLFDNVSQEAFRMFLDYFRMIMNEYHLDLSSPNTDKIFEDQIKEYFFGGGGQLPDEFVPEK